MRLEKVIMINRAPFDHLELDFGNESVTVLSGINGCGKTTIISHIVDSFYELAKKAYDNEFEHKANKYYRVSSAIFSLNSKETSIVYLRFAMENGQIADYIDVREYCDQDTYDRLIILPDKIPYSEIERSLKQANNCKHWSLSDKKEIDELFSNSILTYFPAYRYETPSYLNDPYAVSLTFNTQSVFSGYLANPIEVTSDLQQLANWIMDVYLDLNLYRADIRINLLYNQLNSIVSTILQSKAHCNTRLGFGPRSSGSQRIAIISGNPSKLIYPSIFNMSSGELALLCLFGELVKQSDKVNRTINDVSGVVLVDEIDKHLHAKMQKEILPRLVALFPNLQFIVTSHSPFFGLGLEESPELAYQIFDLGKGGVLCPPDDNNIFREAYEIMISENDRFYDQYKQLQEIIKNNSKPLIITEGKTDWKHLEAAMKALTIIDLDIEFNEYQDTLGDTALMGLLDNYARISQPRIIIGMFDRDNLSAKKLAKLQTREYLDLGNNVYAFAIPAVNSDEYGESISIEHYYKRTDLTSADENGRRLFLADEFYPSGNSKDGKYHTRVSSIQHKLEVNGVIDEKVYDRDDLKEERSVALTKDDFAELIVTGNEFANGFDYSKFNQIFDVIRKIVTIPEQEETK